MRFFVLEILGYLHDPVGNINKFPKLLALQEKLIVSIVRTLSVDKIVSAILKESISKDSRNQGKDLLKSILIQHEKIPTRFLLEILRKLSETQKGKKIVCKLYPRDSFGTVIMEELNNLCRGEQESKEEDEKEEKGKL